MRAARELGDYGFLSKTDIKLLALAYQYSRDHGQPRPLGPGGGGVGAGVFVWVGAAKRWLKCKRREKAWFLAAGAGSRFQRSIASEVKGLITKTHFSHPGNLSMENFRKSQVDFQGGSMEHQQVLC